MLLPLARTSLLGVGLLLASVSAAHAQDLYDWPAPIAPVLITTGDGVLFLHQDGRPFRAYAYLPTKIKDQPSLIITDIDRSGKPAVIGAGKPTFALGTDGDPLWNMPKGCKQVLVADFVADTKLDIMCTDGRELKVFTHDNQFVWGLSLGRTFGTCRAGDTNGDRKADLECELGGKKLARVDGATGQLVTSDATDSMINADDPLYTPIAPIDAASSLADTKRYDLSGDGQANDSLVIDGKTVAARGPSGILFEVKLKDAPIAALVKDLDKDGKPELILLTKNEVIVANAERQEASSLSAKRYKRKPVAEYESVYANGFGEGDQAARQAARAVQDKLGTCYTSSLKKSDFAGSGQLLLRINVGPEGKIGTIDRVHSEIADNKVVECAQKELAKLKVPAPTGDAATINVTLRFTFRDQL